MNNTTKIRIMSYASQPDKNYNYDGDYVDFEGKRYWVCLRTETVEFVGNLVDIDCQFLFYFRIYGGLIYMATEFEKRMEKHMKSIDSSLASISKSLARIAKMKEEAQAASNRETDKESWDVFDNLSKLSGTKLL